MRTIQITLTALLAAACTPGGGLADAKLDGYSAAEFSTEADLVEWANSASAPNVYTTAALPLLLVQFSQDADCPEVTEEGDTTTYSGECTDDDGNTWSGTMTVTEHSEGAEVTYDAFTLGGTTTCGETEYEEDLTFEGTITQEQATGTFTLDVVASGQGVDTATCEPLPNELAWSYEGTLVESGDVQTWSGSGRVGGQGIGVVHAMTTDEVIDDATCSSEASSGTTTLEAGGDTAVITYDGATDCDEESTVTWTFNGEDQGEVAGVGCTTSGAPGGGTALLLVGLLPLLRRRRDG